MSTSLYPVPGTENDLESLVEPFLESTVAEEGLSPDAQFLIIIFGEEASEQVDRVREIVADQSTIAAQASEIDQLSVRSLDERRLNTFTTSLLFNLLEEDPEADLRETIQSDVVTDEDERKIDYYLPRVADRVSEMIKDQRADFETRLEKIFPVDLDTVRASEMHDRLEKDIVTGQTILDYLFLAASSTEDPEGVRSLISYLRENRIDDAGYLSGGEMDISGYQRVFSLSYNLNSGEFNDEFQTARSLYEEGSTPELIQILNQIDPNIEPDNPYTHESPIERLLTAQFAGNNREIARRLLRVINATRAVENEREAVQEAFEESKAEFEKAIQTAKDEASSLTSHNNRFDTDKVLVNMDTIETFEGLVDRIDQIDSTIAQYLLGYGRSQRTSVFKTLATRIEEYASKLQSHRNEIDRHIDRIEDLEQRLEKRKQTVDAAYNRIDDSSVVVDLPPRQSLKQELESTWDEQLDSLRTDLMDINLDADPDDIAAALESWEESISDTSEQLDTAVEQVNTLETFSQEISDIDNERESVRETLREINTLIEEVSQ